MSRALGAWLHESVKDILFSVYSLYVDTGLQMVSVLRCFYFMDYAFVYSFICS